VQVAGTLPRHNARVPAPDPAASLRILLTHYPRLRVAGYQLVLAGHMHAGQIVLPYPGGKVRLAHLRSTLAEGVYRRGGVTLHVSPGLGTTFVPFRFFARPEATELVLQSRA
jgi:predicted MPP superfamily phosphohydrolase